MKRTWLLVATACVALFVTTTFAAAAELPSPPFDTNTKCLQCHATGIPGGASVKVDFAVPAVSYDACRNCHAAIEVSYQHEHSGNCNSCHFTGVDVAPPLYASAYGRFQNAASLSASAQEIHSKHVNAGRQDLQWSNPGCLRCHAPISCSACHVDDAAHGAHAATTSPAITYAQTNGTSYANRTTTCVNASCHSLASAGTAAFTPTCASCHAGNVGDHGGDHSYTAGSDYSEATQSGCSNSGAGCHGSDSARTDMRSAYDHIGCLSGPCHTSTSKPLVKAPLECAKCHAGNYAGAPNRMALTSAYPNGHFNETTHTATAMTRVIGTGGSATASCATCHASALPAAHAVISSVTYGSNLSCAECHNDTTTSGYLQVTANWTGDTCEDCHTIGSAAPFHGVVPSAAPGISAAGCGASGVGCHSGNDLHSLHKSASSCLIGCHSPDTTTVAKSCGASDSDCHTGFATSHPNSDAVSHTATGDIVGTEVYGGKTVACATCHSAVLGVAHANTVASTCTGCHSVAKSAAVINAATAWDRNCSACHPVASKHAGIVPVHQGQPVSGNTCMGSECHPNNSTDLTVVHSGIANSCELAGCHDAANKDARPSKKTCGTGGDCHAGMIDGNHGGDHTYTTLSDYNDAAQTGCTNSGAGCHGNDTTYGNMRAMYGHTGCLSGPCHTSASKAGVTGPLDCVKCHAGTYAGAPDRFALTDASPNGHYNETTHTVGNGIMTTQYVSAGGLATAACIVCHDRALPAAHATISSAVYGSKLSCAECHNDMGTSGLAQVQAGWTTGHCEDCHTIGSAAPIHGAVAPIAAAVSTAGCAASGVGCHASANLHEIHKNASSCQIGCHTKDQGAVTKSCGSADSGCHKYYETGHFSAVDHTATGDIVGSETVACVKCHSAVLTPAHSNTAASTCSGCHANAAAIPVIAAGWDKNCSACHAVKHAQIANHVGQPTSGNTCVGAGCHPNNSTNLLTVHSGIANSCELSGCHDAANKDKRPTKKSCGTGGACHGGMLDGNHGGDHSYTTASDYNATTGAGCTNSGSGCHGADGSRADMRARYGHIGCTSGPCHTSAGKPSVDAPLECAKCHAGNYAGAPNRVLTGSFPNGHYNETTHTATAMTRTMTSGGTASATCSVCHDAGMRSVHTAISSTAYGTNLSCFECHNDTLSNGNAQVLVGWSSNKCDDCHKTGASAPMHSATIPAPVTGSTTAGCTTGTGCHVAELHALHKGAASCALAGCHVTKNVKPTAKTCGAGGACHTNTTGNHEAQHDTAGVIDPGCAGCHFTLLTTEHSKLGYTCSTCHASTNAAVKATIASNSTACDGCHPAVNGKDYHKPQNETEFIAGNASAHRVTSDLPGMRSSFRINNATYTWTLPTVSSFLKTGWAVDSIVACNRCHTYTGAAGPHGATMNVNIDPAYPGNYQTAYLGDSGSSPTTVICAKCHTNFSGMNKVHGEGDHQGSSDGKCVNCHAGVPHGWRLPRLLAYTTDPAPYRTVTNGLAAISLSNHSPSNWSESNCEAACGDGDHRSRPSSVWPSTVNTVGTLRGTVKSSAGATLSGVTVTTDKGQSATTNASGAYDFGSISTGTYQVTAALTGYASQTKPATLGTNQTVVVDFTLAVAPITATNWARSGTGSASSTYYGSSYSASRAFDGSTSTYWRSSSGGTQWLRTDLGSAKSVGKVVVKWYDSTDYARAYRIETSTDGTNWTSRYTVTSGASSGTKTHTFPVVSARYVRIYCTSANSSSYRIGELEAWNF